jgi:hypothetical protein
VNRRAFLGRAAAGAFLLGNAPSPHLAAQFVSIEAGAPAPLPIPEPHFPDRLHLFIWRNWELANAGRLAQVLGTTPKRVLEIGVSMGLPSKRELTEDQLRRIYITTIRQNWHVLPDEQIAQLLGWDSQQYEYHLKEDDFLWLKLGAVKPRCEKLTYGAPSAGAKRRAAEIKRIVEKTFGPLLQQSGEPPFAFVERLSKPYPVKLQVGRTAIVNPRYVYSYFALYGDPLMETGINPFPDGFLERLADAGMNGVWLQAVLRNMAPSKSFPEFGRGWERRLRNLNKLIDRAAGYGVKIYFYLDEPRSMPAAFFAGHPAIKGTHDPGKTDFFCMCTSTLEVRRWIHESLAHLFHRAPGLGGIFCITASENLTNCFSHGHPEFCPRCSKRNGSEVIAELIQTLRDGIRRSSKAAEVIAWDWGWGKDWVPDSAEAEKVIPRLPKDVAFLSVSEWAKAIDRGGHRTRVSEYSISAVGPGPRALQNWNLARNHGMRAFAKVQWSSTWEISAVPYIPVPDLILDHCEKLSKAGIRGLMASWTVGGYPSPNFEVAKAFYFSPAPDRDRVMYKVAAGRYGPTAAGEIVQAWKAFSRAFMEYPMEGGDIVYHIPVQHGPANLLRLRATGYKAGMMLFPYDDYQDWVGSYPAISVQKQFEKMASLWKPGLDVFRRAVERVPVGSGAPALRDLGIAETCYLHFKSVANQIHFYRLRAEYEARHTRAGIAEQMETIARNEIKLARRLFEIARQNSEIAFEASNQYYYRPLDLVEKVLNCQYVIDALRSSLKNLTGLIYGRGTHRACRLRLIWRESSLRLSGNSAGQGDCRF